MVFSLQICFSLILDALFGDPRWYPHPVRGIGFLIERYERFLRSKFSSAFLAGFCTFVLVLCTTFLVLVSLLFFAASISSTFATIVSIILIYMGVSTRDLVAHSNRVYRSLTEDASLEKAREEVGKIVGRDTTNLDESQVAKACVETVAENMVDGTTAPLFYAVAASFLSQLFLVSPIGCAAIGIFLYKAVNTMDSMIGYKNEKYLEFGKTAAIADDILNYFPARLSGLCLVVTAFLLRFNWTKSWEIYWRDRNNHSSPNAAHPEAAMAGALGIELGGPSCYFGKIVEKPSIGDRLVEIEPIHIQKANIMMIAGAVLVTSILLLARQYICHVMT